MTATHATLPIMRIILTLTYANTDGVSDGKRGREGLGMEGEETRNAK